MAVIGRALRGVEAGLIAAGGTMVVFLALDVVRLQPLATVGTLSGVIPGPGAVVVDLTDFAGAVAAATTAFQIVAFTFGHLLAFALAGILASFLFDWSRPGGLGRLLGLAILCSGAFFASVAWSNSVVAVEAVGVPLTLAGNLLAAILLGAGLYVAHMPDEV